MKGWNSLTQNCTCPATSPLRFVPEESNLSEARKLEFALRDNLKARLEGRVDAKKRDPSGKMMHEAKVNQF